MHVIGSMQLCNAIAHFTQIFFHLTVLTNTTCEQRAKISFWVSKRCYHWRRTYAGGKYGGTFSCRMESYCNPNGIHLKVDFTPLYVED